MPAPKLSEDRVREIVREELQEFAKRMGPEVARNAARYFENMQARLAAEKQRG